MANISIATAGVDTLSSATLFLCSASSPIISPRAYARPSEDADSFRLTGYVARRSRASTGDSKNALEGVVDPIPAAVMSHRMHDIGEV